MNPFANYLIKLEVTIRDIAIQSDIAILRGMIIYYNQIILLL
jgi:hypothetical protein